MYGQEKVIKPSMVPFSRWHDQGPYPNCNPNLNTDHIAQPLKFDVRQNYLDYKINTLDNINSYL